MIVSKLLLGNRHYYHTLTDTAKQLKEEFDSLLRDCSKKLTDMCKLEKQTWQELDETNVACDELIEKVNTKSEELVSITFWYNIGCW